MTDVKALIAESVERGAAVRRTVEAAELEAAVAGLKAMCDGAIQNEEEDTYEFWGSDGANSWKVCLNPKAAAAHGAAFMAPHRQKAVVAGFEITPAGPAATQKAAPARVEYDVARRVVHYEFCEGSELRAAGYKGPGWYCWDETFHRCTGPFGTEEEARAVVATPLRS